MIPELRDLSYEELSERMWFNNSRDKEVKRRSDLTVFRIYEWV